MDKKLLVAVGALACVALVFREPLAAAGDAVSGSDDFTRWDALFRQYGHEQGVPWRWLKALCIVESSLGKAKSVAAGIADPTNIDSSVSFDGKSWGLMQLTLATARGLEGQMIMPPYLNEPVNSVRLAAKLVHQLMSKFGIKDRESVIRAYNGGPGFMKTFQGRTVTPIYYKKFEAALAVVMQKQPGNELEI